MDWLSDNLWAGWLALAVALGALELVSLDLFLIMLAGGAVVGAVTAACSNSVVIAVNPRTPASYQRWPNPWTPSIPRGARAAD